MPFRLLPLVHTKPLFLAYSTEDLTPIPTSRTVPSPAHPPSQTMHVHLDTGRIPDGIPPSLRGRVEQGVDVIAGSANRVISGVFDTSFGVLRALMPGQSVAGGGGVTAGVGAGTGTAASVMTDTGEIPPSLTPLTAPTDAGGGAWGSGVRLLRRESGFSIAGLAASLPGAVAQGARSRAASRADEAGQRELVEVVSWPASVRSGGEDVRSDEGEEEEDREEGGGVVGDGDGDGDGKQEGETDSETESESGEERDTRSIKSFESMMRNSRKKHRRPASFSSAASTIPIGERKSLADRLSSVRGLSRLSYHESSNTKVRTIEALLLTLVCS